MTCAVDTMYMVYTWAWAETCKQTWWMSARHVRPGMVSAASKHIVLGPPDLEVWERHNAHETLKR